MSIATGPEPIPASETAVDIEKLVADFEQQDAYPKFGAMSIHSAHVFVSHTLSSSSWHSPVRYARFSDALQPEVQPGEILSHLIPSSSQGQPKPSLSPLDWELLGEFIAHGAKDFPVQYADALRDLDDVVEEAEEEGFPVPKEIALDNAKRLLREMYTISPRRFEVYPMPDGEVAIDAPDGRGSSVLLLCDSDGGALCLVNMKGKHRRARYSTTEALPDGFIREAMAELEQQNN